MIKLEFFEPKDSKILIGWIKTEKELIQFAGPIFKFPLTERQIENYLYDNKRTVFKVVKNENNRTIGIAEVYEFSEDTSK